MYGNIKINAEADRVLFMVHIIYYNSSRKQKRRMTIAETGIIIDIVLSPRAIKLLLGTGFVSVRHSQAFHRKDAEHLQITGN